MAQSGHFPSAFGGKADIRCWLPANVLQFAKNAGVPAGISDAGIGLTGHHNDRRTLDLTTMQPSRVLRTRFTPTDLMWIVVVGGVPYLAREAFRYLFPRRPTVVDQLKVLAELIAAAGEAKAKSLKVRISTAAKTRWQRRFANVGNRTCRVDNSSGSVPDPLPVPAHATCPGQHSLHVRSGSFASVACLCHVRLSPNCSHLVSLRQLTRCAISGCDRRGVMLTRKRFQGRSCRPAWQRAMAVSSAWTARNFATLYLVCGTVRMARSISAWILGLLSMAMWEMPKSPPRLIFESLP
jgi:hypothetical protein